MSPLAPRPGQLSSSRSPAVEYSKRGRLHGGPDEGRHDLVPWLQYSHGVLIAAYLEFEQRVGQMGTGRGAKREMVIDCIRHLSALS